MPLSTKKFYEYEYQKKSTRKNALSNKSVIQSIPKINDIY